MRIVIFACGFSLNWYGGIGTAAFYIAKGLAEKGHEVHILSDYKGLPRKQKAHGFYLHHFKQPNIRIVGMPLGCLNALGRVREINPDFIIELGISWRSLLPKKLLRKPCLVWGRGIEVYTPSNIVRRLIIKPALKNADVALAVAEDIKKQMQKIYIRDIFVLSNGVDMERFENLPRHEIRQKLTISDTEKILIFVGTLKPIKGLDYLIGAMKHIVKEEPQVLLWIIGADWQWGQLQSLVENMNLQQKIVFTGFVSPDEIPNYMAAADVFVLPSLGEGFPNVLLEAMAAGLPIVATNVGGIPEIVTDGENGFLVEPGNSQQLAEKILFLLENEDMRKLLSSNNIKKAEQYDWSEIVTSLEEVYLKAKRR